MNGLTIPTLGQATKVFLSLAYPAGPATIPPNKCLFWDLGSSPSLELITQPPVCQTLLGADGQLRGYAFRLGCSTYPHLKLQVVQCDQSQKIVFAVDTHDAMKQDTNNPDTL